jgi:hypothetical protein
MTGNGLLSAMAGRAQNLREQDAFEKLMRFIDFDLGKYYDGFFPTRKDFLKAVEDLFTLPKAVDSLPRQAILITTGQIAHPDMDTLLELIRTRGNTDEQTSPCSGMFTLGIGSSHCNYNTLTNIGKVLGGAAEFVWDASDIEAAKTKLMRQMRRALQPPLQNIRVEWEESLQNEYELVQTPDPMLPFYSEDLVPVYALLRTEPEPGIYEVELCADVLLPAGPSSAPASPSPDSPGLNSSSSSISLTSSSAAIGDGPVVMQVQSVTFKPEDVELEIEFLEDSDESSSSESSEDESSDTVAAAKRKAKTDSTRARPGMSQDTTLHILGMTERIFDIEDSVTPEDEAASYKEIVDLATAYSFTSNYTAFYATSQLANGVSVTIMTCEATDADEEPVPNPDAPVKFKYGVDFMLQYRDMCLERPEGLPMIKGVTESRPRGGDTNGPQSNGPMSGAGRNHRRAGQAGGKDGPRVSSNSKMATPAKQGKIAAPGSGHRRNKSRGGPVPERKSLVVKGNWESKQVLAPMSMNGATSAPAVDPAVYAALFKRFQSDLNKLTRDNFDRLAGKLITLGREEIKDVEALRGVIGLIFETAVAQPKFATMYSDLCVILARNFPEFEGDGTLHLPPPEGNSLASSGMIPPGTPGGAPGAPPRITFKRLLLNRCQMEFENAPKPEQVAAMLAELPQEDRDEKELKIRTRALSNMTFVGELFNKSMLSSKIILAVLQGLFGSMKNPPTDPTPENIEMANKLMRSVGKLLEEQVPEFIRYVMDGCKSLQKDMALDSRIRFMLLGLVELQDNEWVPREQQADLKPKTIKEIHEDMRQKELDDLEKEEQQIRSSSSSIGRSPRGGKLGNSSEFSTPARARGGFSGTASPRSPSNLSSSAGGPVKRGGGSPNVVSPTPQQNSGSGSRWQARPPSRPTSPSSPLSSSTSSLQKGDDDGTIGGNERRKLAFSTAVEKPQSWSAAAAGKRQQQQQQATPSSPTPTITVTSDAGSTAPASKPFEPTGKVYSEEEVEENVQLLVDEFITSNDSSEAINCLKELKASSQDVAITQKLMLDAFEKKEPSREKMIELFSLFTTTQELSAETVTEAFQNVLADLEDFAIDIPFAPICTSGPNFSIPFFVRFRTIRWCVRGRRAGDFGDFGGVVGAASRFWCRRKGCHGCI